MTFYRHAERQKFDSPLTSVSRVAVIAPNFQEKDGVRTFQEYQFSEIEEFQPDVLAGSVRVLLRLAEKIRVSQAVVAFSGARVGRVSSRDRDLLWSAHQVPVFEQCLSPEGAVIARECEAHDGLHLYLPRHYHGAVRTEACPCGRPEPRFALA